MKHQAFFLLSLIVFSPIGVSYSFAQSNTIKTELKNLFLKNLVNEETSLEADGQKFVENKCSDLPANKSWAKKRIKGAKSVKKYQDFVWKVWKEANKELHEEKLIALDSLSEIHQGQWHLPASLEPNATLPYYFGKKMYSTKLGQYSAPNTSDTSSALPLFIYIHGSGPKDQEWKTGIKLGKYFDDAPCIYFIPQIPNEGEYYRWWQKAKQYTWEKLIRQALVSEEVDANRMYIFGISEGGYGSQRLASFYADYWASAGPMAGGEPLKNAPVENCANIGFSLLTGAEDTGFYRDKLTGYIKESFDSIEQAYHYIATNSTSQQTPLFKHRIELIPHRQHHIDYSPTTPWLKTFTRNPYPHIVLWEDYAMDGRHRSGFYNLQVLARPSNAKGSDARTFYEMSITRNTIDLQVLDIEYQTTERDSIWGIELKFMRKYHPSTNGKIRIYLNEKLVDLDKPVKVMLNGKTAFEGKVEANLFNMISSMAEYHDPYRIYPSSIELDIK